MLAVVVGVGVYLGTHRDLLPIPVPEGCTVDSADGTIGLSIEQMDNAGTIAAVGMSRSLPERAVTISLATAMQESKLINLTGGDRDSIGLFQQRPSMGWGTPDQIGDPVYATNKFLDKLVQIQGYTQLPLTVAAQDVQHSGFPDAYATHETDATVLSGALTGRVPAALNCTVNSVGTTTTGSVSSDGLQPGASAVVQRMQKEFGRVVGTVRAVPNADPTAAGTAGTGTATPARSSSATPAPAGLALDVTPRAGTAAGGWAMAQWAVAHCQDLHIADVEYAGKAWTSSDSTKGWQASTDGAPTGSVRITVAGQ
ncbi:hypothetical protein [Streptacidiphilus sp. EB129]|uniref:hypothetical protein n=1 Tax=Streptacidiphilus sp. EB129 TaxID=3156262 RepID=UPI0035149CB5